MAGLNFLVVVITAQALGAAGRGEIGIFGANLALVLLINGLIGGTGLTYLTPRTNIYQLLVPSYAWAFVSCALVSGGIFLAGQTTPGQEWHLFFQSLLMAFFTINTTVLLGKEKVTWLNYLYFLQMLLTVLILAGGFMLAAERSVQFYFTALYLANGTVTLISVLLLLRLPDKPDFTGLRGNLRHFFTFGSQAQLSNIITFFNYRLGYYFLNTLADSKAVGIFSVGVSLSEAIWLVGRSLALVQYAKLVNTEDAAEARNLTITLAKLSFVVTLAAVLVLSFIPSDLIRFIFGKEFGAVKSVIWVLGAGIVANGTGMIFSHYFAGKGQYKINNWAAALGLTLTVPGCLFLIPEFGSIGAAMASGAAYILVAAFQVFVFLRQNRVGFSALMPGRRDFLRIKELVMERLGK